jgi:hypothetical protein
MLRTILAFFGYVKVPKEAVQISILTEDLIKNQILVLELSKTYRLRPELTSKLVTALKRHEVASHAITSFLQSGRMLCFLFLFILSACTPSPTVEREMILGPAIAPPEVSKPPYTTELYTTDAEITPYELFKWEAIYISPETEGIYYIVSENPMLRGPIECAIEYILCRVNYERGKLTGYAYYQDAELFIFELQADDKTLSGGHFAEVEITFAKRRVIDYFLLKFLELDKT